MDKTHFIGLVRRTFILMGFSYFGFVSATQDWNYFTPAFIAGGLYFFTELARIYKVGLTNQTIRKQKKKLLTFAYLI